MIEKPSGSQAFVTFLFAGIPGLLFLYAGHQSVWGSIWRSWAVYTAIVGVLWLLTSMGVGTA